MAIKSQEKALEIDLAFSPSLPYRLHRHPLNHKDYQSLTCGMFFEIDHRLD